MNHQAQAPEPIEGSREGIAAHMGHVLCPACGEAFLTGAALTAGLMYRLHWRDQGERERLGVPPPTDLEHALVLLRAAIKNGGPSPEYHRQVMARHRAEWRALWTALDRLLAATEGTNDGN